MKPAQAGSSDRRNVRMEQKVRWKSYPPAAAVAARRPPGAKVIPGIKKERPELHQGLTLGDTALGHGSVADAAQHKEEQKTCTADVHAPVQLPHRHCSQVVSPNSSVRVKESATLATLPKVRMRPRRKTNNNTFMRLKSTSDLYFDCWFFSSRMSTNCNINHNFLIAKSVTVSNNTNFVIWGSLLSRQARQYSVDSKSEGAG